MIGAGFIGRSHLQAAAGLDEIRYVGVVDSRAEARCDVSRQFGMPCFASLEQALDDLDAEAVDICVPTYLHSPLIAEAAARGLHILCEKPLTLTLADAVDVRDLLARTGSRLMVAEVIRFWPEYAAAVELVRSGAMGSLRRVHLERLATSPPFNDWMIEPDLGGGAVVDLQVHDFSFLLQLAGPPISIAPLGTGSINDVSNILTFASGLSASNRASFTMPTSYIFRSTFQLELDGGVVSMDDWRPTGEKLMVFPRDGARVCPPVRQSNPFREELSYFCRQIRSGQDFDLVPLEDSIISLQMCLASRDVQRSGAELILEPIGDGRRPAPAGSSATPDDLQHSRNASRCRH